MKTFADKSFDLVLTDPPYGMNLDTDFSSMVSHPGGFKGKLRGNTYAKVEGDEKPFDFLTFWKEASRLSKKHIYFGADYYIPLEIMRTGSLSIWDKRLTDSADKIFGSCFESVWMFPKTKRDIYRFKWAGLFGMEKETVNERFHPTQKPEGLMQILIEEFSEPGDIVLDPFAGSGSTLVACKMLDRNATGIEISPEYCEIAQKRLDSQANSLFS